MDQGEWSVIWRFKHPKIHFLVSGILTENTENEIFLHYNYLQHPHPPVSPPRLPQVWAKLICAGPSKVVEMPSHSGSTLLRRTVNYVWGKSRLNDNRRSNPWSTKHLLALQCTQRAVWKKEKLITKSVYGQDRSHICIWYFGETLVLKILHHLPPAAAALECKKMKLVPWFLSG